MRDADRLQPLELRKRIRTVQYGVFSYWMRYYCEGEVDATAAPCKYISDSRERLSDIGCSDAEIEDLTASGYLALKDFDVLIDRFYGGPLCSIDCRTRHSLNRRVIDEVIAPPRPGARSFPVLVAHSVDDAESIARRLAAAAPYRVVFRGQITHYRTTRKFKNSYVSHPELGETSLIPSVWRKTWARRPLRCEEFEPWALYDWSSVFFSAFDLPSVHAAIRASGGLPELLTTSDMADHPDPLVAEFGEFQHALMAGHNTDLAVALNTLLQHYGLDSPVLDVTTSMQVALFFATHRFDVGATTCSYVNVGTNGDNAIIYVLRYDPREMTPASRDAVVKRFSPLRPERQACSVVLSSSFALNLPADYIVAAIKLVGGGPWELPLHQRQLFPDGSEDKFLDLLKRHPRAAPYVTSFEAEAG